MTSVMVKSSVTPPVGFEAMDIEWEVNPQRSALHLIGAVPTGWSFFALNRKETKAVITYIRALENLQ